MLSGPVEIRRLYRGLACDAFRVPHGQTGAANILGRAAELEVLRSFLADVAQGPRSLVLAGEPGIGKTTLWRAAVTDAHTRGYRVLACRPIGSEVQLSFAALGDLLGPVLGDALPELPPPQRHALEVALLLEEPGGFVADGRSVGVALLSLLRIEASLRPVLIAIDDAQWLDRPTVGALRFAVRRLQEEPVSLLMTARAEADARQPHDLERAFADSREHELRVEPLSAADMHRLLRERLHIPLPRPLLLQVHRTSGGNPFYALELAQALELQHGRVAAGEPLPIPPTLHELLRARLAVLPQGVRDRLLTVACLSEATVATVEAVTSSRGGRRWLGQAVAAGVLETEGDRVTFTHPLLASSVYADASHERRRRMHGRLAELLADPEARARHLALAVPGRSAGAASSLEAAARQASGRGAPDAAAELLELAIDRTPAEQVAARERRQLQAADALFLAGATGRAVALLQHLADGLPPGRRRADVLVRLGWRVGDLEVALQFGEQALAESGDSDELLSRAHLLLGAGWPLHNIDRALRHGRRALRHAESSRDSRLVIEALARLAQWSLWAGKNPSRFLRRAFALESEGNFGTADDKARLPLQLSPQITLALWRMYQGRLSEAQAILEVCREDAVAWGDEPACVAIDGRLADVAFRAGDWRTAEAHVALGLELAEQIGHEHDGGLTLYFKALAEVHAGRVAAARSWAEAAVDIARAGNVRNTLAMASGLFGVLEISLGNETAAMPHMKALLEWLAKTNLAFAPHPMAPYALEALIASGELEEARSLAARYEREAQQLRGPWMLMIVARIRGLIAAAEGDLVAASDALAAARSYEDSGAWPFERARTLLALGRLRRRQRQKGEARECFEQALAIFDALPAPLWSELVSTELGRLGLRRSTTRQMTESERRVAKLAASGFTNREVAAKLFMSPKTVEAHLARAYRKLGIHSRAELGARLAPPSDETLSGGSLRSRSGSAQS